MLNIVNCHTQGVVCDVLVSGLGNIPGDTMSKKKAYFEQHLDHIRTMLLHEPRGNRIRSVNVLTPSTDPRAEFGFLVLEATEIAEMSGGNTIGVATVLVETGLVEMQEPVTRFGLDTPAGLIEIECTCRAGKVVDVTFTNQPAFVYVRDAMLDVPGLGDVRVDVAWGGMCYLIVNAEDVGLKLIRAEHDTIVHLGEHLKAVAREQLKLVDETNPDFVGVQCTLFAGPLSHHGANLASKNAVVVSPGWIDRCPCGTGTSARLALLSEREEIAVGEALIHESLIGTKFRGVISEATIRQGKPAVIPQITGRAWITGLSQVGIDPDDPFPHGFLIDSGPAHPERSHPAAIERVTTLA